MIGTNAVEGLVVSGDREDSPPSAQNAHWLPNFTVIPTFCHDCDPPGDPGLANQGGGGLA